MFYNETNLCSCPNIHLMDDGIIHTIQKYAAHTDAFEISNIEEYKKQYDVEPKNRLSTVYAELERISNYKAQLEKYKAQLEREILSIK